MIYGVEASESGTFSPAPPPVINSVYFSGPTGSNAQSAIRLPSITCTDNGYLAWAGWFKSDWWPAMGSGFPLPYLWQIDPYGLYLSDFFANGINQYEMDVTDTESHYLTGTIGLSNSTGILLPGTWQHIIGAVDVNHANGSKLFKIYVDATSVAQNINDGQPAWTFANNGKDFWLGDDGYGDSWKGEMYDFSFWPGVNFFHGSDIDPAIIALFRDPVTGKPVNPSVAIAALGAPAIMCTGGVAGFLANSLGTSGALEVPAGYDSITTGTDEP